MFCEYCGEKLTDKDEICPRCKRKPSSSQTGRQEQNIQQEEESFQEFSQGWFDSLQAKLQKLMGIKDHRRITHPYDKLGGWLAFIAYYYLISAILCSWNLILTIMSVTSSLSNPYGWAAGLMSGHLGIVLIPALCLTIYTNFRLFYMIQKRDNRFLRFYEDMTLVSFGLMVIMRLLMQLYVSFSYGFFASILIMETVGSLIISLLVFGAIFSLFLYYYNKSKRVRIYFGSDEYIKKSRFGRRKPAARPTVPEGDL